MSRTIRKRLGKILMERNIIIEQQLNEALKIQELKGGFLGQILVSLGYATEEQVVNALTSQFGFPYLPLKNYEIDPNILKLIPESIIRHYHLIPIDKMDNIIVLAMADPLNDAAIEDVKIATNSNVRIFVSGGEDIEDTINRYFGSGKPKKITKTSEEYMTDINFKQLVREKDEKEKL